ncbi:MAG: hypothetical protein HYZ27_03655, partial [Deltaproteobacteria bacterium]|nr:hypothetical protein [Deltaproteobacteria bacterium]
MVNELATAQELLLSDATPPHVAIDTPADDSFLASTQVPVRITWLDPETGGAASGIDLTTAEIFFDGADITAELFIDVTGADGLV